MNALVEKLTGSLAEKRRYAAYRSTVAALPEPYRSTVQALERYLLRMGPGDGSSVVEMLSDLGELFQQSAADGVGARAIVGDDPAAFAEDFLRNYPHGSWIAAERSKLAADIAGAIESSGA